MTAFDLVQRAQSLGLRLVQIADNLPLDQLDEAERVQLKALADESGVAIEVGTRGIAPDNLRTYLALAVAFGSPVLRVVVDTATHHPDVPEVIETLEPLLADFAEAGVTLAIENHDRFSARTLAGIIERLDSSAVGICLDTVNSFGALEGPDVVVDVLGPYVVNLHIKDFAIGRLSHNMGFLIDGRPAGRGFLDVPWLLDQLRERTFNAIIELWPPPEATIEATIDKEAAWAEESVAYLRELIPD
jgi:sugar phosphate isomerase/epimerase